MAAALAALVLVGGARSLAGAGAPGDRPWVEAHSAHAIVVSNAGADTAVHVAREIARLRATLDAALGDQLADTPEPAVVLAVDGEAAFRELAPHLWSRGAPRPRPPAFALSGPYTPFIALRVDTPPAVRDRVLRHEYVHLLVHVNVPDAPAWLDEGLAEMWSLVETRGERIDVGRPPAGYLALLHTGPWIPLAELTAVPRGRYDREVRRTAQFYAQAWALAHYLLFGPEAPASPGFVPDRWRWPEEELLALDRALREYVRAGRYRVASLAAARGASPGGSELAGQTWVGAPAGSGSEADRPGAGAGTARPSGDVGKAGERVRQAHRPAWHGDPHAAGVDHRVHGASPPGSGDDRAAAVGGSKGRERQGSEELATAGPPLLAGEGHPAGRPLLAEAVQIRELAPAEALARRGSLVVAGPRPEAALPLLEAALALDPGQPLALEGRGLYHFLQNEPEEARAWFGRAVAADGASYRAHYYYAVLMAAAPETAVRHLRRALELRPGFAPACARLAALYAKNSLDLPASCVENDQR